MCMNADAYPSRTVDIPLLVVIDLWYTNNLPTAKCWDNLAKHTANLWVTESVPIHRTTVTDA